MASGSARALAAAVAALAACNVQPDRPSRDFERRQLVAAREPPWQVLGFSADRSALVTASGFDGQQPRYRNVAWQPLDGSAPRPIADRAFRLEQPGTLLPGRPPPILVAHDTDDTATFGLTIFFPDTGERHELDGVAELPTIAADRLTVLHAEPDRSLRLWAGPADALAVLSLPLEIGGVGQDVDPAPGRRVLVLGRREAGAPAALYRLDVDTLRIDEVVPSRPTDLTSLAAHGTPQWLTSADGVGVLGAQRMCAGGSRCFIEVVRSRDAALSQPFRAGAPALGLTSIATSLAMAGGGGELLLASDFSIAVEPSPAVPVVAWAEPAGDGRQVLRTLDLETRAARSCPVPAGDLRLVWRPRGHGVAIQVQQMRKAYLFVETDGPQPCAQMPGDRIGDLSYSSDGQRLAWAADGDPPALWLAAGDGSGAAPIVERRQALLVFFRDDHRLTYARLSNDGFGLAWLDANARPPVEHALAEQVFGVPSFIDGRHFVQGTGVAAQDKNGTLQLIDFDTGAAETIDTAVLSYAVAFPRGARETQVIYNVRGRDPSSHDGIWLARLPVDPPPATP